ncbi:hypothetical protein pb186bvf_007384 [Paramecium bursaria]
MLNSQTQNSSANTILGYVPALVVQHLLHLKSNKLPRNLPEKQNVKSVVMFADISGFTMLTETLSKIGYEGAEVIAFAINRYMELLVKGIGRSGGDIFKFAGDAMIVIWPPPPDDMNFERNLETLCKQAIQSALDLQAKLNNTDIFANIKLSVKIGIMILRQKLGFGVGEMNIIHVGGIFARTEYLATGDPLTQAFSSEHCCTAGGQTIISKNVYDIVGNVFECQEVPDHHHFYTVSSLKSNQTKVRMKADALIIKNNINPAKFASIKQEIQSYIPAALMPYIEINEEAWSAELRRVTIMFVNLSIDLTDAKSEQGLQHIQRVIQTVQKCIYFHEGSLNKLLMDDKGSTLIVVFGLPPLSHQNDPLRAIMTAFSLRKELPKINCQCSIGIATGNVFAGVVGTSGSRREYSVLRRFSQLIGQINENKILIDSETARSAESKMNTKYYKSMLMKGKSEDTQIYIPLDKPLSTSNKDLFPNYKTHVYASAFQRQLEFQNVILYGRDEQYKKILNQMDKVNRGVEKKCLIILKGTYGVGKSILIKKVIHRVQEKINSNQYSPWKYTEMPFIFITQLNPISKGYRFNGVRNFLKQIFIAYSSRIERQPNMDLFNYMVDQTKFKPEQLQLMQEILGLKEMKTIENFPAPPNNDEDYQDMKKLIFQFLSNFFEQIPEKYSEYYDGRRPDQLGWDVPQQMKKTQIKYSIKNSNIIAPVVIILDDMQNYDFLSFKILTSIVKAYDRLCVVGIVRESFQELQLQMKNQEKKKSQEDIVLEGLSSLEDAIESNHLFTIHLRGIEKKGRDDEFIKMIRFAFNIQTFQSESKQQLLQMQQSIADERRRQPTVINITQQETINKEMNHQLLFFQNKERLMDSDIELLFTQFVYLKTSGIPLLALNLVQNLVDQGLIMIGPKYATITNDLIEIINHEETIVINAPTDRIEVNGPIIDKLTCLEQLLLKVASSIGDIFDIQTLNKINPFKLAVGNRLQKILEVQMFYIQDLESRELLEVMEIQESNIYYRFTYQFFRECLYQRIIYKQRRQLHLSVAEAIQQLPQAFETEELQESRRLQFHWIMSEQRWSLSEIKQDEQIKSQQNLFRTILKKATFGIMTKKQAFGDPKDQNGENMSSKAMRSIILKQISNKFSKSNNDINTKLQDGILEKKSDSNVTWAERYCLLDGKEFKYYYSKSHFIKGDIPLSTIPLRNIYNVIALFDKDKSGRDNVFQLSSTIWYKKNKEMSDRKFLFNAKNEEQLEKWIIYLEFAKAKAVYDDFTNNYGKITFPIGNTLDSYDMNFKYDVGVDKRMGGALTLDKQTPKGRGSLLSRNSRVSKFTAANKQIKFNMLQSSIEENTIHNSQVMDSQVIKERVYCFLQKGMLLMFSHLFDMALQKQDDYKVFGQTNTVMRKMNSLFKVEKSLVSEFRKTSSAIITEKDLSPSNSSMQQKRQTLNLDSFQINIQRLSKDSNSDGQIIQQLEQIKEDENENNYEASQTHSEANSLMLDSVILKQSMLRQQRVQNQKVGGGSFGDDSFQKMTNQMKQKSSNQTSNVDKPESSSYQPVQIKQEIQSRSSQESFQDQIRKSVRRNTEQTAVKEVKIDKYNNYFMPNQQLKQNSQLHDFPLIDQNSAKSKTSQQSDQWISGQLTKSQQMLVNLEQSNIMSRKSKDVAVQASQESKPVEKQQQQEKSTHKSTKSLPQNNKSVSKSSIDKSDVSSIKEDIQSNYQELNQNILQLLDRLNSKVESPPHPTVVQVQIPRVSNYFDEGGQRNFSQMYLTRGSHISTTQQQQSLFPINIKKQESLKLNNQILSQQNLAPNAVIGTALNTCKSLSGDVFVLKPGNKITVLKIDREKKLAQCSYQNRIGLFHLKDIAVIDEQSLESPIILKSRTPSTMEVKYKQMLHDRFNRSQSPLNYKTSKTSRSITPMKTNKTVK